MSGRRAPRHGGGAVGRSRFPHGSLLLAGRRAGGAFAAYAAAIDAVTNDPRTLPAM